MYGTTYRKQVQNGMFPMLESEAILGAIVGAILETKNDIGTESNKLYSNDILSNDDSKFLEVSVKYLRLNH